jgi:arabinose-5-phosphate isomerase
MAARTNVHLDLIDTCIDREIAGLTGLREVVRSTEYQEIINHLSTFTDYSKRIIVAGVGKNSFIAEKATASMASLGIPAMPLNITHCSHGDFGAVGPNDTIIHISRSGKTKEMLEVITYVSSIFPNVKQILIHCNSKKDPSSADFELWCGDVQEGDKFGLAPTATTTTLLCLLDTIAVELSHRLQFGPLDFFKYHPGGSLGASFTKVGFIYKTTNLVNGKFYVGQCSNDPREKYLGSGLLLNQAIEKYGRANFRREILQYAEQADLDDLERIWIKRLNAQVLGYNIQDGGKGGERVTPANKQSEEMEAALKRREQQEPGREAA